MGWCGMKIKGGTPMISSHRRSHRCQSTLNRLGLPEAKDNITKQIYLMVQHISVLNCSVLTNNLNLALPLYKLSWNEVCVLGGGACLHNVTFNLCVQFKLVASQELFNVENLMLVHFRMLISLKTCWKLTWSKIFVLVQYRLFTICICW